MQQLIRSERGTSMVEFALLAPVLILLVVGLIEVGRYTYFGILAAHAAETAARYGADGEAARSCTFRVSFPRRERPGRARGRRGTAIRR